ncbi:hypoxanthine phosphoribosyltransferase [Protofrankia symbiont of Coriaria ruscifolia]|uniref:hypoxanthine phosphoribosyltransferase n=1 Tax=Protofrankia symbiont of Coriaria ruscifolia TaxID=1306542 RepID=UPI0010410F69|nr:hypoxanthine phosphoribosyltransferase [Protofrankia symbiont of Coriaria ruscifolia]
MRERRAVTEVRVAVRRSIADLAPGSLVLAACSGGPDSLALAAALAFIAPRRALRAGLVTVDHGWYEGSAAHAATVAVCGRALGLDPVEVLPAYSPRSEGAARDARRSALIDAAQRLQAGAVLLGHTLDDQAETVLLRLARGSGARSLAGMPRLDGVIRRPLLDVRRSVTRSACLADGLTPWDDPANADEAFARARVRHRALPVLEDAIGPGIAEALARTADLLRTDTTALDADAALAYDRLVVSPEDQRRRDHASPASGPLDGPGSEPRNSAGGTPGLPARVDLDLAGLAALSEALRTRLLRRAALAAGSAPTGLRAEHVRAMDDLVTRWRGQKPVPLPSGVVALRADDRISVFQAAGLQAANQGETPPRPRASGSGIQSSTHARDALVGPPRGHSREAQVAAAHTMPDEIGFGGIGSGTELPPRPNRHPDIAEVLVAPGDIATRIGELAVRVDADYAGREVLLLGVLKGAVMVMADLSRALTVPVTMEFMAVSSYGSSTSSSGVVRILKDLDRSIEGRDVLVVEDIIDSGLTLSWLLRNLRSRGPASLEVLTLLRKPEALAADIDVRYVGFDIPSAFVVGYGLDYAEHYRTLPYVGTLNADAIERGGR